ncbi:hypothetical protein ENUP19_0178G0013, partial [Entamoeba nuttalli]
MEVLEFGEIGSNEHKSVSSWRGIPNQGISKARFSTLTNNRICVGADYSICVWDAELEECINTFKIEETVDYSTRSFTVVTTSKGETSEVCLYDIRKISEIKVCKAYKTIDIPENY